MIPYNPNDWYWIVGGHETVIALLNAICADPDAILAPEQAT